MTDANVESLCAQLRTGADFVRWGASAMTRAGLAFHHGRAHALDEAIDLVCHALSLPADTPPHWLSGRLLDGERRAVAELLLARITTRQPAAYLIGEAWFAGLRFSVDTRVLVPRSPVAELIEQGFAPWVEAEPDRVLDLCCGGGCIGIATAMAFPQAEVVLADVSADALDVARANIARYQLGDRVTAVESDLFHALAGERFDLIVTNPPYVPRREVDVLPAEFGFEPRLGLESGEDGLTHPRRIVEQARAHLTDDGVLIGEVGAWWPELEDAFPDVPFTWIELERGGEGVFMVAAADLPEPAAR